MGTSSANRSSITGRTSSRAIRAHFATPSPPPSDSAREPRAGGAPMGASVRGSTKGGQVMDESFPPPGSPAEVVRSLHRAASAHDLDGIVAHFAPDYALEDPVHPDRSFH